MIVVTVALLRGDARALKKITPFVVAPLWNIVSQLFLV
jgi:hypothetical protein